jgi:hypothetical protein
VAIGIQVDYFESHAHIEVLNFFDTIKTWINSFNTEETEVKIEVSVKLIRLDTMLNEYVDIYRNFPFLSSSLKRDLQSIVGKNQFEEFLNSLRISLQDFEIRLNANRKLLLREKDSFFRDMSGDLDEEDEVTWQWLHDDLPSPVSAECHYATLRTKTSEICFYKNSLLIRKFHCAPKFISLILEVKASLNSEIEVGGKLKSDLSSACHSAKNRGASETEDGYKLLAKLFIIKRAKGTSLLSFAYEVKIIDN